MDDTKRRRCMAWPICASLVGMLLPPARPRQAARGSACAGRAGLGSPRDGPPDPLWRLDAGALVLRRATCLRTWPALRS